VRCSQRHLAVAAIGVDLVLDFATPPGSQALRNSPGSFAALAAIRLLVVNVTHGVD
jgi:hypothetical protein